MNPRGLLIRGVILVPALAQEVVQLRRVEEEAVTVWFEKHHGFGARRPIPRFSVVTFNDPERCRHGGMIARAAALRKHFPVLGDMP